MIQQAERGRFQRRKGVVMPAGLGGRFERRKGVVLGAGLHPLCSVNHIN
jgi:hypothetical protein